MGARYGILVVWGLVIALFGALGPATFLTTANFQTIFGSQAVLLILAIGLIISLTAGEFDLSFAGVMSVSLVLVGWLNVEHHWAIGPAVAAAIIAAILIGCINAFSTESLSSGSNPSSSPSAPEPCWSASASGSTT